jgi:hypothetical protein
MQIQTSSLSVFTFPAEEWGRWLLHQSPTLDELPVLYPWYVAWHNPLAIEDLLYGLRLARCSPGWKLSTVGRSRSVVGDWHIQCTSSVDSCSRLLARLGFSWLDPNPVTTTLPAIPPAPPSAIPCRSVSACTRHPASQLQGTCAYTPGHPNFISRCKWQMIITRALPHSQIHCSWCC